MDFLEQCCTIQNTGQLIQHNLRRPDYLFHLFMSFVHSDVNKQALFLRKLSFETLDFMPRSLIYPIFAITTAPNLEQYVLLVEVDYNNQFDSFCDELQ